MATPALQDLDRPIDPDALAAAIAEPLLVSAPIAFRAALEHCAPLDAPGSCRAYHAVWQYLRLADQMRSLKVDGSLYVAAAERLARSGSLRRVLVTATADYAMLAHLAFGARRGGAQPTFHIVDRCTTALGLNRWYGDRMGLAVQVTQADIREFKATESYDLVCAHSFVSWLPMDDRPALFRLWRGCLAEEGRVCFSTRVWQGHYRYEPEEMDRRVDEVAANALRALELRSIPLPCDAEEFGALLKRYGRRREEHRPLPLTDIEAWASAADLKLEVAAPLADLVEGTRDASSSPFPMSRGPRMWFQGRAA